MKLNSKLLFFFLFLILISPKVVFSESGPLGFGDADFKSEMATDRPDFTEGTQIIDAGHFQIESGYTYYYDANTDGQSSELHVLPEFLLRIGIMEDIEFRFNMPGYIFEEQNKNGLSDFSSGYKHSLFEQGDVLPEISYIAELGLPTGSDNQGTDGLEPALKILWAYQLNEHYSIAGNINFASRHGQDERFIESAASLSSAYAINEKLGVYSEYFGIYPEGGTKNEFDQHYLNGGFTYGLNDNLQLDIRSGFGLNSSAADFFSGIGLSYRI